MKEAYLIVVDMQNDFVTGSLGTREAERIVAPVVHKASSFSGTVLFTQDSHGEDYLDTQEGKILPVKHCIVGTPGWQLVPELKEIQEKEGLPVYQKNTFGCLKLVQALQKDVWEGRVKSVELVGLCTDICVISNALLLKAHFPELPLFVDAACCAGVTPQRHEMALSVMESCQIQRTETQSPGV